MSTRELTSEQQEKFFLFIKSTLDGAEAVGIKSIPLETEIVRGLIAKLEYTLPRAAALDWLEVNRLDIQGPTTSVDTWEVWDWTEREQRQLSIGRTPLEAIETAMQADKHERE